MNYDLHIHSNLSPCAEAEMSPNNIVRMAKLHELDIISICDHNHTAQQAVMAQLAKQNGIQYWYGIEINTKEDVHLLAYFKELEDIESFQKILDKAYVPTKNKIDYFGHQSVYNIQDEIIDEVEQFLLIGLSLGLEEIIEHIHAHKGKAVLAHIYGRENGIMQQLGFIPKELRIDGIELVRQEESERFLKEYPHLETLPIFINSDAHTLIDMIKDHHQLSVDWFETS